jgi:DNA-directed RNA polymerase specialized sigma24 family protein
MSDTRDAEELARIAASQERDQTAGHRVDQQRLGGQRTTNAETWRAANVDATADAEKPHDRPLSPEVRAALEMLTEAEYQAVELTVLSINSPNDAADWLGVDAKAVYNARRRALAKLRRALDAR